MIDNSKSMENFKMEMSGDDSAKAPSIRIPGNKLTLEQSREITENLIKLTRKGKIKWHDANYPQALIGTILMTNRPNEYNPDYVTHPGIIMREIAEVKGVTLEQLQEETGNPVLVLLLWEGKGAIMDSTAKKLESILGIPTSTWLKWQENYSKYIIEKGVSNEQ